MKQVRVSLLKVMNALFLSVGSLLFVSLAACAASNGNGHHEKPAAIANSAGMDGSWYCHTVSGPNVRDIDGKDTCHRSRARCQKLHKVASQLDLQPGPCKPQRHAFCFSGNWPELDQPLESCMKTGEECDRVYKLHKSKNPSVRLGPCIMQKNDKPPVGDIH